MITGGVWNSGDGKGVTQGISDGKVCCYRASHLVPFVGGFAAKECGHSLELGDGDGAAGIANGTAEAMVRIAGEAVECRCVVVSTDAGTGVVAVLLVNDGITAVFSLENGIRADRVLADGTVGMVAVGT